MRPHAPKELGPLGKVIARAGKAMFGELWKTPMQMRLSLERHNFQRMLFTQVPRQETIDGIRLDCVKMLRQHATDCLDAASALLKERADG